VHIRASLWALIWVAFTVAMSLTRALHVAGFTVNNARLAVFGGCQGILVAGMVFLFVKLSLIKQSLRPLYKGSSETRQVSTSTLGRRFDLLAPAYENLPEEEISNWRQPVRRILKFRPPRNKHERLFGLFGASGPQSYAFFIQGLFFLSTLSVTINFAVMQKGALLGLSIWHKLASFLPSLAVLVLMPTFLLKLNYVMSCEQLTKESLVSDIVMDERRSTFITGIRSLLCFSVLFRDDTNNLFEKIQRIEEIEENDPEDPFMKRDPQEVEYQKLRRLPQEEVGILESVFRKVANDEKSGVSDCLTKRQLQHVIQELGVTIDQRETDLLFHYMDRTRNGEIDFEEFASVILLPLPGMPETASVTPGIDCADNCVNRLFDLMDVDHDGELNINEMMAAMELSFPSWNRNNMVLLFREIDTDNSDTIDRQELSAFVRKGLSTSAT